MRFDHDVVRLETLQQVYQNFFGPVGVSEPSASVPPRHQSDLPDAPETRAADSFGPQEQKTTWDENSSLDSQSKVLQVLGGSVYLVFPASRRLRHFVLVPVKHL